jgi:hypothetical protein
MLWACKPVVSGDKCKVIWAKVCRPKGIGGLGILDLDRFAMALRRYGKNGQLRRSPGLALEPQMNLFNAATW